MNAWAYIDGVDIYEQFGVIITENGYNQLLTFPALREPVKNNWAEHDGIEVDLSEPTLLARSLTIPFASIKDMNGWESFFAMLAEPGYRTLNIPELERTWNLRVESMPRLEEYEGTSMYSVKFVEDKPSRPGTDIVATGAHSPIEGGVSIDGKRLDEFGVFIVDGLEEIHKAPSIKRNLLRNISTLDGQIYDTERIVYNAKDVRLKCCLIANSMADFWNCYDAFFGMLIKPKERILKTTDSSATYPCYYKNSSGFELLQHLGEVVCIFNLTLVFTEFRINEKVYLLASEDDELIITEDGFYIDLS